MKHTRQHGVQLFLLCLLWGICAAGIGCGGNRSSCPPPEAPIPRELRMTTHPTYHIGPSDILLIQTLRVVPKPPYRVSPLDSLMISVEGTVKEKEINALYVVDPSGYVDLGLSYGTVYVDGMTIAEAREAVKDHLSKILKDVRVNVGMGQSRAMQQINGPHLVRQDGTVSLGVYGSVYIAGMTIDDARQAVEEHLSQYVLKPEIALDVYIYNNNFYYLVMDRATFGQTVIRLPITGRETVLDALSNFGGTWFYSSNYYMWLARPNGQDPTKFQIFPIDWPAITKGGSPLTNYQLLPGDRIYVQSNPFMRWSMRINQFWMPTQSMLGNIFGLALTGNGTVAGIEGTALMFQSSASTVLTPGGAGTVGVLR
jgi:polysaccharide export outer membrane protein